MSKPSNESSWRQHVVNQAILVITLIATVGLVTPLSASAGASEQPAAQPGDLQLPTGKQTTLGLYVTAREAYEKWKAAPDKVMVIDVRTPEEFLFVGHAEMAWNIPFLSQSYEWDAGKKQFPMQPLTDFVARVKKIAKPDDTLLVTCRSGPRGALAVNQLAAAGFKNVYNITDGMEGDAVKDPDSVFRGQRLMNGWKNAGLPWTYDVDPARMVLPAAH